MQHSCSLLCLVALANRTRHRSVTHNSTSFLKIRFFLLIKACLSQVAPSYVCLIFHMHFTRTVNNIFLDCVSHIVMVQIIYELLWSSARKFSYLHPAFLSSILFPHILLRTPFLSFFSVLSKCFCLYLCRVVYCGIRR